MPRPLIPDRRGRILDAAGDLALANGWEHTSIAAIAAAVGIGKGAIYREFHDKTSILDAMLIRSMRRLVTRVHRQVLDSTELVDLPMVYRFGVEALLSEPLMRAMFLADSGVLGRHVHTVDNRRYLARFGWLRDYIERLQHAGAIDASESSETIAATLSTFTIGLINTPGALGDNTPQQLRDSVTLFADLVGRGLASLEPVDAQQARTAQLDLLNQLSGHIDLLEESP